MNRVSVRRVALVGVALAAAVGLAACTSSGNSSGSSSAAPGSAAAASGGGLNPLTGVPAPAKNAQLAAEVPAKFRSKALTVGTDATLAPKEFLAADNKTIRGLDVDLVYAVGDVLGLKMNFVNANFDTLIPGVQNGRYDLVNSSAAPTPEREKVLDMVTTDFSGEQLLVKASNAKTITSLESLCGHTAAVQRGSLEQTDLETQSAKCKSAGKSPIGISIFPDANAVNLALNSGHVDAAFMDVPVSSYQAKQSNGALVTTGNIVRAGLESMFTAKGNGMAKPLAAAMNELIANGTYEKIFQKWGLTKSVLKRSVINPATEQG